jgi:hypothetical protein
MSWPQLYLGVSLTTLATLLLELSLTRIYSVVFYYHFAFLAISLALFGLGAGGVFSYYVIGRRERLFSRLGTLAALNGIAVVAALLFIISRPAQLGIVSLALLYFSSAVPFFLAGTVISLAIGETVDRVNRVYLFDLLGAAAGCLALVPFLNLLGGPNTVMASAVLFAVSGAIWFNMAGRDRGRATAVVLALAIVSLIALNFKFHLVDIRYAKGKSLPAESYVKWNSFSRIAIAKMGSGRGIFIDADASTGIAQFDWDHFSDRDREVLLHQGPGIVYELRPGAKTLIIGPGGGWDVARALASGSADVTGVEINPIIARTIMQQRFPQFSNYLYKRPDVHIYVEDGRSFVRHTPEKYQVLQATLVDTWASTAAGAYALTENNLYTREAFGDYFARLTGDGVLSFTRWGFQPPRESLRLVSLAIDALSRLGEHEAWRHVIVVREHSNLLSTYGAQDTVLFSRKPFSGADLARVRQTLSHAPALQAIYVPGDAASSSAFAGVLLSGDRDHFRADYPYNISSVTDDRPFFFYTVQPRDVRNYFLPAGRRAIDYKINRAVPLLFGSFGVSLVAMLIVLAVPPFLPGTRLPASGPVRRFLGYFVCIGAGYILIQVALIQKFVLFLGHPTYALTVIIFSMLLSSGIGSFYSRTWLGGSPARLRWLLGGVAVLVAILAFSATPLMEAGMAWPLAARALVTVAVVAPAGFLMGMPFPTGLSLIERLAPPAVRWAWALNAASSVLGSAGAVFVALYLGLRTTILIGACLYLGAMLFALVHTRAGVVRDSAAVPAVS